MEFSYFIGGSKIVKPTAIYSFKDLIELYKTNFIKDLTTQMRICSDPVQKAILKNKQPFVTPYGTFTYRENKSIIHHNSNLVAFDFDKMDRAEAIKLKAKLSINKSCMLATISGSGKGVKAFFLISDRLVSNMHYTTLKHNKNKLLDLIGINEFADYLDLRQFVLSQPMFISYDPDLHYNFEAEPLAINFEIYKEPERKKPAAIKPIWKTDLSDKKINSAIQYVKKATENLCNFYASHTGARHDTIAKTKSIAGIIKHYNLPIESEIYTNLENSIVGMYGDPKAAKISNAYKSFQNAWETAEPIENETVNKILYPEAENRNQSNQQKIALIENQSSADFLNRLKPEYLWLSIPFEQENLNFLRNKNIVAFPKKNQFNSWQQKAKGMNSQGFKIVVSDLMERLSSEDGTDLADFYNKEKTNIKEIKNGDLKKQISDIAERNDRLGKEIKSLENTFIQASERCEVKWFAPEYIDEPSASNRLQQLIYWTS
jgi:hypothetical protein